MNCTCTHCGTVYRVDPAKVPADGVRTRCSNCQGVFRIEHSPPAAATSPAEATAPVEDAAVALPAPDPAPEPEAPRAAEPSPAPQPAPVAPPVFGATDPHGKARRLARALISDIVVYHRERRDRSLREGTLRQEFREEIRKSWDEYQSQVGEQTAKTTPYFREALNEILAGGASVF